MKHCKRVASGAEWEVGCGVQLTTHIPSSVAVKSCCCLFSVSKSVITLVQSWSHYHAHLLLQKCRISLAGNQWPADISRRLYQHFSSYSPAVTVIPDCGVQSLSMGARNEMNQHNKCSDEYRKTFRLPLLVDAGLRATRHRRSPQKPNQHFARMLSKSTSE